MSLTTSQQQDLLSKQGYNSVIRLYLNDYLTKALFMPEKMKSIYKIEIKSAEMEANRFILDNIDEIAKQVAVSLAVSTDSIELGKDYTDEKMLLADLKTDTLKPAMFKLFHQWLPKFYESSKRKLDDLKSALE